MAFISFFREGCTNGEVLKKEVLSYFQALFYTKEDRGGELIGENIVRLSHEARLELIESVSKGEVYRTLMFMKSYKAQGLDGSQPISFKMYWHMVGDDI